MDIGERLRSERDRLDKSQSEFAETGGIQKVAQSNYERGIRMPDAQYLQAIAKAGADVLYILTGQRSQAVAEVELLPQDERALVDAYRRCAPQGRQHLIQTAALLSAGLGALPAAKPARASKGIRVGGSVSGGAVMVSGSVTGGIGNGRKK